MTTSTESEILTLLRGQANPEKAAEMAAYHKTGREVLGASNPQIDAAVRTWREGRPIADWLVEADTLWASGIFEARIAASKLLTKARFREGEDATWKLIASWVPEFDGWAIADHAAKAGERRIMTDLARLDEVEAWTRDDSIWVRRAALVFTLPLAKLNHLSADQAAARKRVLGWMAGYSTDRAWFIQKAIGWWLRTLAPHDPQAVRDFLAAHGDKLKPVARREATRKLPGGG